MSTLDDIIGRVQTFAHDSDGVFITPEDIAVWCNDAITDLVARTEILDQESTGTTSSGTIALPPGTDPDLLDIRSLTLGTDDFVSFTDSDVFDAYSDAGSTPLHTLGRVFGATVELYPTPAVGTAYTLRYKRLPRELADGSDVLEIPRQLERKVVAYCCSQAAYKNGDFYSGDRFLQTYEEGLPPVSLGREEGLPGPLSLIRETYSSFERNPDNARFL